MKFQTPIIKTPRKSQFINSKFLLFGVLGLVLIWILGFGIWGLSKAKAVSYIWDG